MVLVPSTIRKEANTLVNGVITRCLARVFCITLTIKLPMMDSGEMTGYGATECFSTKIQKCSIDHTTISHGMMLMSIGSDTRATLSMTTKTGGVSCS
jgi:hypothetical protein